MSHVRVDLPWSTPPLSANARDVHQGRARKVAATLADARWAVRAARLPALDRAAVDIHYRVPNRKRRDGDNLAPVLKAVLDALVAEGVLPDDGWQHVPRSGHVIHPPEPGLPGALWVEVEALVVRA